MRKIDVKDIEKEVAQLCQQANYSLSKDMIDGIKQAKEIEDSPIGEDILKQLLENLQIAQRDQVPICQDTGMVVLFVEIGQEVMIKGGSLKDALDKGVAKGYNQGNLRKSVVEDPILRQNTGDNTPAIIYYDIVEGDKIKITLMPKGFGSENMSAIKMLKPSDGIEGIKEFVIETVEEAGPNACPPIVVGVGIGGTMDKCALLAKRALLRSLDENHSKEHIANLEKELLEKVNNLGIGPMGLGGRITALGLKIETFPTHIAGLPVAVNICCHVNRHKVVVI